VGRRYRVGAVWRRAVLVDLENLLTETNTKLFS
jgi:hypothetical protein